MIFKVNKRDIDESELEITSFMNLMIVLVPVLLLSLTFTRISVLDINLPELSDSTKNSANARLAIEIVVRNNGFQVYYPSGVLVKKIPMVQHTTGNFLNLTELSQFMQQLKQQLNEKRDILILAAKDVSYQNLIATMDTVKSYQTIVATSVVEVELFPVISLGDAS